MRKLGCVLTLNVLVMMLTGLPAPAAPASLTIPHAAHPPTFDGALSDSEWHVLELDSFIDFTTRQPAPDPTKVMITADSSSLYVAFLCQTPHGLALSDNVNDLKAQAVDFVEVDLDSTGSGTRLYRFLATPNGLQAQFSSETARYNPKWSVKGSVGGSTYSVEMIIPYRAMRLGRDLLRNARINFLRHVGSTRVDEIWSYDSRVTDLHADTRYWPTVHGLQPSSVALRGSPSADIYALETAGVDRAKFIGLSGSAIPRQPRVAGLDFTVPLSGTVSFVGTLVPDFSNVDVDQTTIAPQIFPFRFREYRPFFVRGQQYVAPLPFSNEAQTSADLFFTPNLTFLDRGAKLEGTVGPSSFGVLTAKGPGYDDIAMGYSVTTADRSRTLALQVVNANHPRIVDRSGGASLLLQNPRNGNFANVEYLFDRNSNVTVPSAANAELAVAGVNNSVWFAEAGFQSVGPQFAPADGFITGRDIRGPLAYVKYSRATKNLRQVSGLVSVDRFVNWGGSAAQSDSLFDVTIQTNSLLTFEVSDSSTQLAIYQSGFPIYRGRDDYTFNQTTAAIGIRSGTNSLSFVYSFGPFALGCNSPSPICQAIRPTGLAPGFLQQVSLNATRQLGKQYSIAFLYAGTLEHSLLSPASDSQWLRRISISRAIGNQGAIGIALRNISGRGGNAAPGINLSALLDLQFQNLDHLYVEFGSPSARQTLDRYLVKYVFHFGQDAGI